MTKYIDADRLRAEIEERKQIHFNDYFVKKSGNPADYGASNALAQVLPLIDSLQQEQPDFQKADKKEQFQIDWESEVEEYWIASSWNMAISLSKFKVIARYFIGLALNARKEK